MSKKKPYEKPKIKEVKMVPQEAFLGTTCKAAGGTNSKVGRCTSAHGCATNVIGS